jgi:flavin reductase (DIM6/NTAB) family NADH-FMN oxidoreductase RutF
MIFSDTKGITQQEFTAALRYVPTAVTIVTSYVGGRPWGLTVSAFSSVSADPPTILVCVNRQTATCATIESSGAFGVSLLAEDQQHVAVQGAASGVPKFLEDHTTDEHAGYSPEWGLSVGGIDSESARQYYWTSSSIASPSVYGAFCHFDCSVDRIVDGGNSHAIVLGRVASVRDRGDSVRPLVYYDRGFHELGPRLADRSDAPVAPPKGAS